jgi:hypothetical protein
MNGEWEWVVFQRIMHHCHEWHRKPTKEVCLFNLSSQDSKQVLFEGEYDTPNLCAPCCLFAWFLLCWTCRMWPDCLTKLMTGINRMLLVSSNAMPYANLSSVILTSPWKQLLIYPRSVTIDCRPFAVLSGTVEISSLKKIQFSKYRMFLLCHKIQHH